MKIVDNEVQVTGQVAVMAINGLLAKSLFDKNPDREFYVEESFPLDWMYPHLTPHGLIMKINRQSLPALPPEVVKQDRDFWIEQQAHFIGDWLKPDTSVKEVCDFVTKVHLRKELTGFKGDPEFVRNDYAMAMWSKLRSSQGGLYFWRSTGSKTPDEKRGMITEAGFAFRQAFAFCPTSPEATFRFVNLLVQAASLNDALLIARTAAALEPKNGQFQNLVNEVERLKKAQPAE